jgi:hypothetical protein
MERYQANRREPGYIGALRCLGVSVLFSCQVSPAMPILICRGLMHGDA